MRDGMDNRANSPHFLSLSRANEPVLHVESRKKATRACTRSPENTRAADASELCKAAVTFLTNGSLFRRAVVAHKHRYGALGSAEAPAT